MHDDSLKSMLGAYDAPTRDLALAARQVIKELLPDATEELDAAARLVAYTFTPGSFRGLVVAIAPQRPGVQLLFPKGAALEPLDLTGQLRSDGGRTRFIRLGGLEHLESPVLRGLVTAAARITARD